MKRVDRDALKRALAMARAESPEQAQQIDDMLEDRPWQQVAAFAAHCCQCMNLHLRPWQAPPCHSHDEVGGDGDEYYGTRPNEVELRQRLQRAKLSVWEPDPIAALEAAERAAMDSVGATHATDPVI
jgi:hypothetical protein